VILLGIEEQSLEARGPPWPAAQVSSWPVAIGLHWGCGRIARGAAPPAQPRCGSRPARLPVPPATHAPRRSGRGREDPREPGGNQQARQRWWVAVSLSGHRPGVRLPDSARRARRRRSVLRPGYAPTAATSASVRKSITTCVVASHSPLCRALIRCQLGPRRRCAADRLTRTRGFRVVFRRQRGLILPIWATQLRIRPYISNRPPTFRFPQHPPVRGLSDRRGLSGTLREWFGVTTAVIRPTQLRDLPLEPCLFVVDRCSCGVLEFGVLLLFGAAGEDLL
jgi:hypothetical protein